MNIERTLQWIKKKRNIFCEVNICLKLIKRSKALGYYSNHQGFPSLSGQNNLCGVVVNYLRQCQAKEGHRGQVLPCRFSENEQWFNFLHGED